MLGDRRAEDAPLICEGSTVVVAQPTQQLGRSLDVGEEQRDRPVREVEHRSSLCSAAPEVRPALLDEGGETLGRVLRSPREVERAALEVESGRERRLERSVD